VLKFKRKLIKFSNYSLCITVPKKMTDKLGWEKGDLLNLFFSEDDKTIKLAKTRLAAANVALKEEEKAELIKSLSLEDIEPTKESEPVVLYQREKSNSDDKNKDLRW